MFIIDRLDSILMNNYIVGHDGTASNIITTSCKISVPTDCDVGCKFGINRRLAYSLQ